MNFKRAQVFIMKENKILPNEKVILASYNDVLVKEMSDTSNGSISLYFPGEQLCGDVGNVFADIKNSTVNLELITYENESYVFKSYCPAVGFGYSDDLEDIPLKITFLLTT